MENHMTFSFNSSIKNLRELNSSFDIGTLYVCYPGPNQNGTWFTKDTIEKCLHTAYNCPVVCNYMREENEIGAHDIEFVEDEDGNIKMVNITDPVGVIPESAKFSWTTLEDASGEHEYLTTDVIIWKRQEAYEKIKNDGVTAHSMEVRFKDGHREGEYWMVDDFEFLAFCLLGNAKPCFEGSKLEMFELNDFRARYTAMLEELKQITVVNPVSGDDIDNFSEGGEKPLNKMELLEKYGLTIEQLDFEIDELSVEELEVKLQAFTQDGADISDDLPGDTAAFSLSAQQLIEGIWDALRTVTIQTEWGEMCKYLYCDHMTEPCEVYCWDSEDWKLYGFTYAMNGDNVVIDFESKKRMKFSIVDFDEGDADFSHKHIFETVADASANCKANELNSQFEVEKNELEAKYNAASETIEQLNTEISELRSYQQAKLSEERKAEEDAVFAMFPELEGVEAFQNLKENCSEMTIEQIEDKCYSIKGRNNIAAFAAKGNGAVRLPVEKQGVADMDEPYNGFFQKYPPTNK